MPIRFYQPIGSPVDQFNLFIDPQQFTEAADNARLTDITTTQGLNDTLRTLVALGSGFASLGDFDTALELEEWEIRDRLDYYADYDNRVENITVRDGAWYTPEAIEDFCGEHATNVAANSVDGDNNTIWQHFQDHQHFITYRLRGYPKKITRIRFRYGSAEPARERLNNLTVRASRDISQILEPSNELETDLNISWPTPGGVWVEHTLATPKSNARYIRLETADTDDTAQPNALQIREFAVRVETRDP